MMKQAVKKYNFIVFYLKKIFLNKSYASKKLFKHEK